MEPRLDLIFNALADPTRRRILSLLLEDDMAVSDVAEPFGISLAAISKHLGVLSRAGLITQERRGRVKWCRLEPDAMAPVSVWMGGFGVFEPVDLDALEHILIGCGLAPDPGADVGCRSENERDDRDDDDDQADDVDDLVHDIVPRCG